MLIQFEDIVRKRRFYLSVDDAVKPEVGQSFLFRREKDLVVLEVIRVMGGESFQSQEEGLSFERKLTLQERKDFDAAQEGEIERLKKVRALADEEKLEMHFFASKVSFDQKQITFFFISPAPVDFRELLKKMVKAFPGRVQLERVKERDRALMLDGSEMCGGWSYPFLRINQEKVPLDTVRDQGIVIKNNQKIFDASGRIKPSMAYEVEAYRKNRRYLPHIQQLVKVKADNREAKVTGLDILNHRVKVVFEGIGIAEFFHVDDLIFEGQKEIPEELIRPVAEIDIAEEIRKLDEELITTNS